MPKSLPSIAIGILLAIMLLGCVVRLYCLTKDGIWADEAVSIRTAEGTWKELFYITPNTDVTNYPPVYYSILKIWIQFFGDLPTAVRMLSVVFGVLTIPAIFYLGWNLFDWKQGLAAALLIAVSPWNIYYSQETRVYILQLLLLILAMGFFIDSIKHREKWVTWGYSLFMTLAIYAHFYSSFIWVGLVVFQVFYFGKREKSLKEILKNFRGQWMVFIGLLPLLYIRLVCFSKTKYLIGWIDPFRLGNYWDTFFCLVFGVQRFQTELIIGMGIGLVLLLFVIMMHFHIRQWKNKKSSVIDLEYPLTKSVFLWLLFLIPVFLFTVISLTLQPIYLSHRYLFILLPAFLLLLVQACFLLWKSWLKGSAILLLVVLFLAIDYQNHTGYSKLGLQEVAQYIRKFGRPQDTVQFIPSAMSDSFFYYYLRVLPQLEKSVGNPNLSPSLEQRVWLVMNPARLSLQQREQLEENMVKKYGKPVTIVVLTPYHLIVCLFVPKNPTAESRT